MSKTYPQFGQAMPSIEGLGSPVLRNARGEPPGRAPAMESSAEDPRYDWEPLSEEAMVGVRTALPSLEGCVKRPRKG